MVVHVQTKLLNFMQSRFREDRIAFKALPLTSPSGETLSTSNALQHNKVHCDNVFNESIEVCLCWSTIHDTLWSNRDSLLLDINYLFHFS